MSPLFRGLEGSGATHEAEEQMTILLEDFTLADAKATRDDDSLSNYSFDITEQEREPPKTSKGNIPREKVTSPLPAVPTLDVSPPPLPPKPTKPISHITGTQPFHIDRSKDRRQFANRPQAVHAQVPYERPPARPIYRAPPRPIYATHIGEQVHLWDKLCPRELSISLPSIRFPRFQPECAENVPVTTLFSTGLIPLERAQDKFKHAHCLERLPHPSDALALRRHPREIAARVS
ncbi:hypothetical protein BGW80DRAFT_1456966 [Lactifluus volemus]|nr:hypothetical protein BGW80DRAFT_1456966 [Lactifluus volemus]